MKDKFFHHQFYKALLDKYCDWQYKRLCLKNLYFLTLCIGGLFFQVAYGLNPAEAESITMKDNKHTIIERQAETLKWIRELKDSVLQSTQPYVEIAKELQTEALSKTEDCQCRRSAAQDYSSLTHPCQKEDSMSPLPRVSLKNESRSTIYVFVSLSMPKPALIALNQEAVGLGATLVLRGLKDNSYQKTALYLQEVIEKTGQGFIVHPELFKRYDIRQVPSVVLTTHPISAEPVFDVISGHIPIKTALLKIAEKGELMHEAKAWLLRCSYAD